MTNFKGICYRCYKKCSINEIYCPECRKWVVENIAWVRCNFMNDGVRRCGREGNFVNGLCPDHTPRPTQRALDAAPAQAIEGEGNQAQRQ